MSAPLLDCHLHLQDARLRPRLAGIALDLRGLGVARWVVAGTRESDWPEVALLAQAYPEVMPCYGLHPWHASGRSPLWEEQLAERLSAPAPKAAAVGEIGLDKWMRGHDIADQEAVLRRQLRLAREAGLPAVIHCLRAWGRLRQALEDEGPPPRGFLLHSFGGPPEMIPAFVSLGAYFSCSGYFLQERKAGAAAAFRLVPPDRLLVETDAPDMLLPEALEKHPLAGDEGERLNHPANLGAVYHGVAALLGEELPALAERVAANFARLFQNSPSNQ